MQFLYKLLKQDPTSRDGVIVTTSALGILVNLVVAAVKIIAGAAVHSIAVISEGMNNASDSITSLLTIIGTKLAGKHPTEKHPFGFGRIEYMTSLIISCLIFITGFELLKSSIELILHPGDLTISYLTLIIVAITAVVKLMLGLFTIKQGERIDSGALVALGTDCRNDSAISAVTIVSALVFLISGKNIDAWAGLLTSLFVLKAGYDIAKDTLDDLLGRAGDKELARDLYRMILAEPIVLNAADLILHNYGPDAYTASVNVEIDHDKTVAEVYAVLHALQLKIMHEKKIGIVFGIYAVDNDHETSREIRKYIAAFVKQQEHVKSFHAIYIDESNGDIYCDLVVDYQLEDWDALRKEFTEYMKKKYPNQRLELVIETKYV